MKIRGANYLDEKEMDVLKKKISILPESMDGLIEPCLVHLEGGWC
jgi:hypothetical protein